MAKSKGGRPPKFTTKEEIERKIEEYFNSCWVDKVIETSDKEGKTTTTNVLYQNRRYTFAGLALGLGFRSRQTLLNYAAKSEFLDTIKRAKLKVEMNVEEGMLEGKSAAGNIFWLKNNAGYRDKEEGEDDLLPPTPVSVTLQVEDASN